MVTNEMIARINELAKKKKSAGLSAEELIEQKELYRQYLSSIRENIRSQLDSIEIVDGENKNVEKIKK